MSWTAVSWVLPKKIKEWGLEKVFHFGELKHGWDGIVVRAAGEKFVGKSRLVGLKSGTLIADCLNSVWANEFRLREARFLEELKKTKPETRIEKMSFIS